MIVAHIMGNGATYSGSPTHLLLESVEEWVEKPDFDRSATKLPKGNSVWQSGQVKHSPEGNLTNIMFTRHVVIILHKVSSQFRRCGFSCSSAGCALEVEI